MKDIARLLDEAARHAVAVPQVSTRHPLTIDEAYMVQRLSMQRRYDRGEQPIGIKLGFTSRAKMKQMGVSDMIWGWLTDTMLYQDGDTLSLHEFIHPRSEPEICFTTSAVIDKHISIAEARDYISHLSVAMEVIDSRYENFKFSLEDVIADNCSSTALVVGEALSVDTDIADISVKMNINQNTRQSGSTAAILGNPWESVSEASRLLAQSGMSLPEGSLIMAGAATAAEYLQSGDHVEVVLGDDISSVSLRVS